MVRKLLLAAVAITTLSVTSCLTPSEVPKEPYPQRAEEEAPTNDVSPRGGSDDGPADTSVTGESATGRPAADAGNEGAVGSQHRMPPELEGEEPPGFSSESADVFGPTGSNPGAEETTGGMLELPHGGDSPATVRAEPPSAIVLDQSPRSAVSGELFAVRPEPSVVWPPPPRSTGNRGTAPVDPAPDLAERIAAADIELQVGQLLMVQFRFGRDGKPIRSVTPEVRRVLETVRPGGVILFSENIATVDQTTTFIRELQAASEIPLFISVDEEGGFVSRLTRSSAIGATRIPSAEVVGMTGDPEYARRVGEIIGTELRSLGINMNMAPVADVNTNPERGIIARYERSFGSDPAVVGVMVSAMVDGLQAAGVSAVLKHFPGHGDTEHDTHTGTVVSESSIERLREVELIPFKRGIESGADGVMTAHIAYPKITGDLTPATFSSVLLTEVLRDELGFSGIVISDALEMGAVASTELSNDPVVAAVAAGVDLVLSPRDPIGAHEALVAAVENGTLDRSRVHQAVETILRAKARRGLFEGTVGSLPPRDVLGKSEHRAIIRDLLESAGQRPDPIQVDNDQH